MKRFEALLGNEWRAWVANADTTITEDDNLVTIQTLNAKAGDEELGPVTTYINLDNLQAYTLVD